MKIPVYNEDTTGKSILDELWQKLTVELNEIGPPIRTTLQWRRVWSVYKYNTKRAESIARGTLSQTRTKARGNRHTVSESRKNARGSIRDQTGACEKSQSLTSSECFRSS